MKNTYLCKCGRIVRKSTNADTTGNRDISGCTGCPYLLPYGVDEYIEGEGFCLRVMGYECRMSKSLQYASRFSGSVIDTCACYVVSLDYEFLEQISDWIKENYPGKELSGGFSQKRIRATDFVSEGRYRFAIACAHNKKGMAAKSALLERFFHPDGSRRDMTPEEEEKKIKDLIENEKRAAQGAAAEPEPKPTPAAPEETSTPAPCLCESCTCTGCKPECFGHCRGCGEPTHDCNSYQTDGEKHPASRAPDGQPEAGLQAPAAQQKTESDAPTALKPETDAGSRQEVPAAQELSAELNTSPAFDYSGLSAQTVATLHSAENVIRAARKDYILRVADAVGMAHDELVRISDKLRRSNQYDELVANCDKLEGNNQYSENTFIAWCRSVGLNKDTAYRLLQVSNLISASTPNEQKILAQASPSLLYAAAKPSAPAEAVAAVKSGNVTTHKEYQELLEEIRARDAKIEALTDENNEINSEANAMMKELDETQKRLKTAEAEKTIAKHDLQQATLERDIAQNLLQNEKSRAGKLQTELETLRAQPIEVAVEKPDPAEIERLAKEKAEAMTAQLQEQLTELAQKNLESSRHAWNVASADFDMVEFAAQTIENAWLQAAPAWNRMELNVRFALRGNLERAIDGVTQALRACEEAADGGV